MTSNSPPVGEPDVPGDQRSSPAPHSRWHSAPWWAGIGGLATVFATFIGMAAWWFPRAPDSPSPNGPLFVTVLNQGGLDNCGDSEFYVAKSFDEIKSVMPMPPPDLYREEAAYERRLQTWVTSVGGWKKTNWIEFSVEGGSSRVSILTGLRVNLVSRTHLTSKTVLSLNGGCGGVAPPRPFVADFNTTPPRVEAVSGKTEDAAGNLVDAKPVTFPFKVSATDPEIFNFSVGPGPECNCLWTVTLFYTQAGRSYRKLIDDNGQPFHGVPTDHVPEYNLWCVAAHRSAPGRWSTCH